MLAGPRGEHIRHTKPECTVLVARDSDLSFCHPCRAHILAKKVSPRAFAEQPNKKGQKEGEVGIEGTTIQSADTVSLAVSPPQ